MASVTCCRLCFDNRRLDHETTKQSLGLARRITDDARLPNRGPKKPHAAIYCLGPYTGRISFVSQQYRALNLIWSLIHLDLIETGHRVAVVGGGLSGITVAQALKVKGIEVKVFEGARIEMVRQRYSTHRYVHPRINWWPIEMDALNPTTKLPFLNWFGGRCDRIVDLLYAGGVNAKAEASLNHPKQSEGAVVDISKPTAYPNEMVLHFANGKRSGDRYDVVILACGFDGETMPAGFDTPQYWDHDNLEKLRDDSVENTTFVVSGCGDGGLIDALRLSIALKIDLPGLFTPPTGQYASNESSGRRSITRAGEGNAVDTSTGKHLYLAYDLLNKACVPIIIDVQARSLNEFGEFNRHPGEEMIFVIEGELDLYTTAYTPANLKTGDTMYFDSNMGHAYIAVGEGRCRILSICLAPETELLNMIQNKATRVTTKDLTEI